MTSPLNETVQLAASLPEPDDDAIKESPNHRPQALRDFEARDFEQTLHIAPARRSKHYEPPIAASLPEKPCPKCGGTGWEERMCDFCTVGHSVTCDCQRKRGEQ